MTRAALTITLLLFASLLVCPLKAQDQQPTAYIDQLSGTSLMVELFLKSEKLGSGTAFVIESKSKKYLISNTHVFSGWDHLNNRASDPKGRIPDQIKIHYHHRSGLGAWTSRTEKLRNDDGSARWFEAKKPIDVAALPLTNTDDKLAVYPLDLKLADSDVGAYVGMPVSIIGFPGGLTASGAFIMKEDSKAGITTPGFPIWKVGHIATDPDWDVDELPLFYIDATTRAGMSGSPVVLRVYGPHLTKKNNYVMSTGSRTLFLGIYSAQSPALELGFVWKPQVLRDLLLRIP